MITDFERRFKNLNEAYENLLCKPNVKSEWNNGVIERYKNPVLTAGHTPLHWRYDFNPQANPFLMERFGINAVLNSGAIKFNNKYVLIPRVEGKDRKSFFAIAESINGIDNFKRFSTSS